MNYRIAIRQGDILFVQVDKKPENCKLLNTLVISGGESSGNKHQLVSGTAKYYASDLSTYRFRKAPIIGYLEVTDKAVIGHEEHLPVTLNAGIYEVIQQKTFNPFDEEVNYVTDLRPSQTT